ncbi:MAG: hypothetical protein Q4C54_07455 [Clostridia bacterium]|nr:hypothetical protein [Clostridia bacterium]
MIARFVPESLKVLPVWCLWRIEEKHGRNTKVPYSARYTGRASSTDCSTWDTYAHAVAKLRQSPGFYNGLGVMIAKEYKLIFVDVDHCIIDGELDSRARDVLDALPQSYAEISQSGSGLHVLTLGEIERSFKNSVNGVEVYSEKRFCAFTGQSIAPN